MKLQAQDKVRMVVGAFLLVRSGSNEVDLYQIKRRLARKGRHGGIKLLMRHVTTKAEQVVDLAELPPSWIGLRVMPASTMKGFMRTRPQQKQQVVVVDDVRVEANEQPVADPEQPRDLFFCGVSLPPVVEPEETEGAYSLAEGTVE
jgi:hypothetical protein